MIYNFDDLAFNILTIERAYHGSGFFHVEGRPFAALAFRVRGKGDFEIKGERFIVQRGDVFFIPQNMSYDVTYSDCEIIVIHFTECNYTKVENISVSNSKYLSEAFIRLLNDWNKKRSVNRAKSDIYKIMEYIDDEKMNYIYDVVFKKCVSYINENFCDSELSISDLCNIVHISESSLLRKFHDYYHISPKQYLMSLRLNKAVDLLLAGELPVKTISKLCGFRDEKYFSRIIKEKYHQPPSAFNKRVERNKLI